MKAVSIIIPTLNPEISLLKQTLNSVFAEFDHVENLVEVLICDNGSETPIFQSAVINEFFGKGLRHIRFSEDLGFDSNLVRAAGAALGKFILFLGDDDLLGPGTLPEIINMIVRSDLKLFQGSNIFFTDGLQPELESPALEWHYSSWFGGAALSTLIFQRLNFLEAAQSIIKIAPNTNWLHFLAAAVLESKSGRPRQAFTDFRVAVRIGRAHNWEAHFGSQYLSGIKLISALTALSKGGLIQPNILSKYVEDRVRTNLIDVLTLTSTLTRRQMKEAFVELRNLTADSRKIRRTLFLIMKAPKWFRVLSSWGIAALGELRKRVLRLIFRR